MTEYAAGELSRLFFFIIIQSTYNYQKLCNEFEYHGN